MFEKRLVIQNKTGLHARPASDLTRLCQKFDCDITITAPGVEVNPKSIISILAGGLYQGIEITLSAQGKDEEQAGLAISRFINELTE